MAALNAHPFRRRVPWWFRKGRLARVPPGEEKEIPRKDIYEIFANDHYNRGADRHGERGSAQRCGQLLQRRCLLQGE